MLSTCNELIRTQDICVLATAGGPQPHCSLMTYVPDGECRRIYMATLKDTRKYRNLAGNRAVSVLFDNRSDKSSPALALTAAGVFEEVPGERAQSIKALLLAKHPHLKELLDDRSTEIFSVKFSSFQLLSGIRESSYISLKD